MRQVKDIVCPKCVLPNLRGTEAHEIIAELVDHLVALERVPAEVRDEIVLAVQTREDEIGTGIGNGVAIPHARIDGLDKIHAVFGRSAEGVDFHAPDNTSAHIVCLLLTPADQAGLHLQILAELATIFRSKTMRQDVMEAPNLEALIELFQSA